MGEHPSAPTYVTTLNPEDRERLQRLSEILGRQMEAVQQAQRTVEDM